jgi:hypothetical protein
MKNLVEEARTCHGEHTTHGKFIQRLADRIEELDKERDEWKSLAEAAIKDDASKNIYYAELQTKLAKAVGLIQFLDKEYQHVWGVTAKSKVRTTLAELKVEDRG